MDNLFARVDLELVLLTIITFGAALLGVWLVRSLANRYGWLASPRKDRWHSTPTALYGGIGFFPVLMFGMMYLIVNQVSAIEDIFYKWKVVKEFRLLGSLFVGSIIMFFLGWLDDVKHYKPSTKLIIQLIATSLFIVSGGVFHITEIYLLDISITYFWFIGIINAVNMLDNMDGLSSGVVMIASLTLVALSIFGSGENLPLSVALGLMLVAGLSAFLRFNHSPASIFMGDSGSLSIGYILAALAIPGPLNAYFGIQQSGQVLGSLTALLIPVVVIAVPIFDTTFVSITRKWRGKGAMQGGQDHPSHRLVLAGLTEKKAVWLLYSLSLVGGLIALLMQSYPRESYTLLVFFVLIMILVGVYLGHIKIKEAESVKFPQKWVPVVSRLLYKRRAAEVLIDTVLLIASYYIAYVIKYDGVISTEMLKEIERGVPLVVSLGLLSFFLSGVYQGQWRLVSIYDFVRMFTAVCITVIASVVGIIVVKYFIGVYEGYSKGVFLIFGMLLLLMLVGSRISFRLLDTIFASNKKHLITSGKKKVLIYGAGKNGKILYEASISSNPAWNTVCVIGFVDDDVRKSGRSLHGLSILSGNEWINKKVRFDELWISSRLIPQKSISKLTSITQYDVMVRRLQFKLVVDSQQKTRLGNVSTSNYIMGTENNDS